MARRPKKPKLTPAEQHALFVATARAAGASEDEKDAEVAFRRVVGSPQPIPKKSAN